MAVCQRAVVDRFQLRQVRHRGFPQFAALEHIQRIRFRVIAETHGLAAVFKLLDGFFFSVGQVLADNGTLLGIPVIYAQEYRAFRPGCKSDDIYIH